MNRLAVAAGLLVRLRPARGHRRRVAAWFASPAGHPQADGRLLVLLGTAGKRPGWSARSYLAAACDPEGFPGRAWLLDPEGRPDADTYAARLDAYGMPGGCSCKAGLCHKPCVHAEALAALLAAGAFGPVN